MAYTDSTQQYQRMLANYTRTGVEENIPGTKPEGIQRYRTMIYNVVNDSLITAYPLTKKLLAEEEWNDIVQHFFASHACQSPFLWRMPFEFLEFVKMNALTLQKKYVFLNDLILYEWVEIEVFMMEDIEEIYSGDGFTGTDKLVLNPSCILQYFQYPVYKKAAHTITAGDLADYFMFTYRDPETNHVRFLEVAPMFARMLEMLNEKAATIDELIQQFSAEAEVHITKDIKTGIEDFFQSAFTKRAILGFKK
jgi:uncharacterized protein